MRRTEREGGLSYLYSQYLLKIVVVYVCVCMLSLCKEVTEENTDLSEKSLLYKIKLALGMMCIAKMFSQTNCD